MRQADRQVVNRTYATWQRIDVISVAPIPRYLTKWKHSAILANCGAALEDNAANNRNGRKGAQMRQVTFDDGEETRTITIDEKEDGTLSVVQYSEGPVTEVSFEESPHSVEVTFVPTDTFGMAELEQIMDAADPDDLYYTDFTDKMDAAGVSYEVK